jgi:hypothetical protein
MFFNNVGIFEQVMLAVQKNITGFIYEITTS